MWSLTFGDRSAMFVARKVLINAETGHMEY